MANNTGSRAKDNKGIFSHPYSWITLAMWVIALGSHAFLIPLFVRQVLMNRQKSSLFG